MHKIEDELGDLSHYSTTYFKDADSGIITQIKRRGLMLALAAPSGTGKTTISRLLLEADKYLRLSTSYTTRPMRANEENGVHYHFVDEADFRERAREGFFLEHAYHFGTHYGTPKQAVLDYLSEGLDVMFDIEREGVRQIKAQTPEDLVSIFLLPPSWDELKRRLQGRVGQDSEERVNERLAKAKEEMTHYEAFDYVVVNMDLQKTLKKVMTILYAERMKRRRLVGVEQFVETMRNAE